ncbi:hypothetical protein [Fibrobacter sp.]
MQDAFAQEKQAVGTWPEIGYSAPGTAKSNKSKYESKVFEFSGAETHNWIAKPLSDLNDCTAASGKWQLNATYDTDVNIAKDASTVQDCLNLTASFDNLVK